MAPPLLEARRLLRQHFGHSDFRPAQRKVIASVIAGRDTLAVLPTGGGKSVCFQVPALMANGLTLVISPLISLMQDQVAAACARGIPAACLNSALPTAEQAEVVAAVRSRTVRLLYLSPERLTRFTSVLAAERVQPALLAVDEAHCIAEWGDDFRPSYRQLRAARYRLGSPPAVALTGSATADVREAIVRGLGLGAARGTRWPAGYDLHLGSFDRTNLWFGVVRVEDEPSRLATLLRLLAGDDQVAIVYAPTRNVVEGIVRALAGAGHRTAPYHAGLPKATRRTTLERFLANDVEVVVATSAFGMGIDKPDVRLVVHWTIPPTPESYYQEAGRAGRDGAPARCVMLYRPGDADLHRRQLDVTFPPERTLERIWAGRNGTERLARQVLDSSERLRRELRPERGPVDWRLVRSRRKRAESRIMAIERYARVSGCRRAVLVGYFGESLRACAGCDHCRRPLACPHGAGPEIRRRVAALRWALGSRVGPWNGALLDPPTLLRLARHPPPDAAALADVPGVGPVLAERIGAVILRALWDGVSPSARVAPAAPTATMTALARWRRETASQLGVPEYSVLTDAVVRALAEAQPRALADVARIAGIGPRAFAKFGSAIVAITGRQGVADSL